MERNPAASLNLDSCCWTNSHPSVSTVGYWVWRTTLEQISAPRLLETTPQSSYTQCLVPQSLIQVHSKLELPMTPRIGFYTHHTYLIPGMWAKSPLFLFFKEKLLINTINIAAAAMQKQLNRKRQHTTWIALSKLISKSPPGLGTGSQNTDMDWLDRINRNPLEELKELSCQPSPF